MGFPIKCSFIQASMRLTLEVFVLEGASIDALATSAVPGSEVTTLRLGLQWLPGINSCMISCHTLVGAVSPGS